MLAWPCLRSASMAPGRFDTNVGPPADLCSLNPATGDHPIVFHSRAVRYVALASLTLLSISKLSVAADYKVDVLKDGPPKGLAADVAAQLSPTGYKVVEGDKAVCEIWLAKAWTTKDDFQPSDTILYPLE